MVYFSTVANCPSEYEGHQDYFFWRGGMSLVFNELLVLSDVVQIFTEQGFFLTKSGFFIFYFSLEKVGEAD
jgi:hypothetical protein